MQIIERLAFDNKQNYLSGGGQFFCFGQSEEMQVAFWKFASKIGERPKLDIPDALLIFFSCSSRLAFFLGAPFSIRDRKKLIMSISGGEETAVIKCTAVYPI